MKRLLARRFIVKEHRKRYTAQSYDVTPLVEVLRTLARERLEIGLGDLGDEIETPPQLVQAAEAL